MARKNLALTPDEAKETMIGYNSVDASEAPKYPYGTCLDLNDESLQKLGITKLPNVGEEVTIQAKAKVTRISAYVEQGGAEQCLGLQITDMDVSIPSQSQSASDKLYGGNPLE